MGGFTRLLHSGQADDLMDEIPTMVVDPLPQDMVEHSWWVGCLATCLITEALVPMGARQVDFCHLDSLAP